MHTNFPHPSTTPLPAPPVHIISKSTASPVPLLYRYVAYLANCVEHGGECFAKGRLSSGAELDETIEVY